MIVNGFKNTEDTQKQTFIEGKMGVPPWNGQSQMSLNRMRNTILFGYIYMPNYSNFINEP